VLLVETATAFLQGTLPALNIGANSKATTELRHHISEWRDIYFENVPTKLAGDANGGEPVREICILPFPLTDVLLQGETKELCLYEERFHKLFEKATTDHAGIVAMGFIAPPSGMLQGMPLCEIENFRTMEGDTGFGNMSILATIRVVGRATLLDVQAPEDDILDGYMTGWCQELMDDTKTKSQRDLMDVYNELAERCDILFDSIVNLQEEIYSIEEDKESENEVLSEATLRRMALEAELGLDDDDDDDDEDDDEDYLDDDDEVTGTKGALRKAIQIAKASDTQGYTITATENDKGELYKRSIQELTALSWGYLSTEVWGEEDEDNMLLKYRLQALNTDDLADRLILVSKMLIDYKNMLTKKREKL